MIFSTLMSKVKINIGLHALFCIFTSKVFGISEYEFCVYLDQVISLGLIEKRVVDGFSYSYSTPKADKLTDRQVYKLVKDLTGVALGVVVGVATEKLITGI